jgi:hypothetical protein
MEIYYVYYAEVKKEVGWGRARKMIRELTGKRDIMTPVESEKVFRFKINHKYLFNTLSLKRIEMNPDMTLVVGLLRDPLPPDSTIDVMNTFTANETTTPGPLEAL